MISIIAGIVGTLINTASDHFEDKRKLKRAKVDSELRVVEARTNATLELAAKGQLHEISWSESMAEASKNSWKDEWFTIVLSLPAIMAFIPGLSDYVELGFYALSTTPEWYQMALLVAISASFGVRIWDKVKKSPPK